MKPVSASRRANGKRRTGATRPTSELEKLRRRNRSLSRRVKELEEALRAEPRRRRSSGTATGAGARTNSNRGKLDANKASFEQLREIGLSVTQSAKLIGRRERSAFRSKAELTRIPGLSGSAKKTIEQRLRVGR